ncbi:RecX family transcriptional regulator [Caldovatus aquaticus]|uniref:Regulatory protein RecX n=1 Tax=Caldovatus aquaticus TaxID=2865671 RepID=A0ABS7F5Q1_9PROT|nr:RecX family transcriptional regulator [Caldovatus aquaticus]MBW8270946.1 RecX family transcriptional regulator [Caldovatus aquaticus]
MAGQREETRPGRGRRIPLAAGPPPDEARLHEAALQHLARFAATEAGLRRVLERRVERWARRAEAEGVATPEEIAERARRARAAAAAVARRLAAAGAVDDAAFAEARARRLQRAGRSRRAIAAHLAARGVDRAIVRAALGEGEAGEEAAELLAALALCRRRRIGPFAPDGAAAGGAAEARRRALGALARAGFPRAVAEAALGMAPAEAEARLLAARREG